MSRDTARRAATLRNDDDFRLFAARRSGVTDRAFGADAAGVYLRQVCQIPDIGELAVNPEAQARFAELEAAFAEWCARHGRRAA